MRSIPVGNSSLGLGRQPYRLSRRPPRSSLFLEWVPGLDLITLGATAGGFGYAIGTAANHKWLHIGGAGLGSAPTGSLTSAQWVQTSNLGNYYGPSGQAGFELRINYNGGYDSVFVDPSTVSNCGSGTVCNQEWQYIHSGSIGFGELKAGPVNQFGAHYAVIMTEADAELAMPLDAPLQSRTKPNRQHLQRLVRPEQRRRSQLERPSLLERRPDKSRAVLHGEHDPHLLRHSEH